jgi:hypothetical protein
LISSKCDSNFTDNPAFESSKNSCEYVFHKGLTHSLTGWLLRSRISRCVLTISQERATTSQAAQSNTSTMKLHCRVPLTTLAFLFAAGVCCHVSFAECARHARASHFAVASNEKQRSKYYTPPAQITSSIITEAKSSTISTRVQSRLDLLSDPTKLQSGRSNSFRLTEFGQARAGNNLGRRLSEFNSQRMEGLV